MTEQVGVRRSKSNVLDDGMAFILCIFLLVFIVFYFDFVSIFVLFSSFVSCRLLSQFLRVTELSNFVKQMEDTGSKGNKQGSQTRTKSERKTRGGS